VDQLSIPMLADQDMGLPSPIHQRHHELLCVPEGDDDAVASPVQIIHDLGAFRPDTNHLPEHADQPGAKGRQQCHLQPCQHFVTSEPVLFHPSCALKP
jgi:hypothetical protein